MVFAFSHVNAAEHGIGLCHLARSSIASKRFSDGRRSSVNARHPRYEETYQRPCPHQRSVDATRTRRHHPSDHGRDKGKKSYRAWRPWARFRAHEKGNGGFEQVLCVADADSLKPLERGGSGLVAEAADEGPGTGSGRFGDIGVGVGRVYVDVDLRSSPTGLRWIVGSTKLRSSSISSGS